jgi:hypothetical protein
LLEEFTAYLGFVVQINCKKLSSQVFSIYLVFRKAESALGFEIIDIN